MGNYTEYHFKIRLKKPLPPFVHAVLVITNHPVGDLSSYVKHIEENAEHDFFRCDRWIWMFHQHHGYKVSSYRADQSGHCSLELHGQNKDWDDEIQMFSDWIKPYIVGRKSKIYLGWRKGDYAYNAPVFHCWYLPSTEKIVWGTSFESATEFNAVKKHNTQ